MSIRSEAIRIFFTTWAKTGKAPGLLYSRIENHKFPIENRKRHRKLYNGLVFECDLRDHVQQQIYFFGAYEPNEVSLFLSLMEPGATVVDAGANIGFYTFLLGKKVGPEGQVHSFEPVPDNFAALNRHYALNGKPANIRLNSVALWNKAEILQFGLARQHENNSGSFHAGKSDDAIKSVACQAIPLAQYFKEQGLTRLDGIKMDIEGAELFALEGARDLLEKFRPVICLEVCRSNARAFDYTPEKLWEALKPFDYLIYLIGGTRAQSGWISDFTGLDQRNVLLIPKSRARMLREDWDDKAFRKTFLRYR